VLVSEELGDDGGFGYYLVLKMVVGVFDCWDETALGLLVMGNEGVGGR
jgi:hypothetical protein